MPVHTLRQYSLIADGERGAMIGPRGDIAWMCAPLWHDDAVFSTLIGGRGCYSVTPEGQFVWGGSYEDGSLIWGGRWVTTEGIITCRDALAMPADPHRAVILRQIRGVAGSANMLVALDVCGGFGSRSMRKLHRSDDGTWTALTGELRLRWTGGGDAVIDKFGRLVLALTVAEGDIHDLVLEISDQRLPGPLDAAHLWQETVHNWAEAVPPLASSAAPRDARLAYAVLRGLTSQGGGMVAAATMSLPERAERKRNYDYRYVWIRDQCYAGLAAGTASAGGEDPLLDAAVSFVTARLLADGDAIKPAYLLDGRRVPDERRLHLPGYPGGQDIAGNWVNQQFQLDSLGESLQLFAAAARYDRLDTDGWRALQVAVKVIEARWQEPDAGIWELENDWWTQSRLACVAGLRAAGDVAPTPSDGGRLASLADAILAETTRTCLNPDGYWQRSPTKSGVDTSLLLPSVRGAVRADDPRTRSTLAAVKRDLTDDYYAYRYAVDADALGAAEGAFLLCGFIVALAEQQQGNRVEAMRWFERNRAACGSPGLFTEEYDVRERQLRGNIPQAFVHAAMLETATRLASPSDHHLVEAPAPV